ncbi:Zn-ribbon domain-containing OB-fold protein [Ferrovibrio sp. MS7]|uniref:Zn-ribbon domain-containing OB-fold protein n=1 Tax=Ferrovibrio plantarum TaxID=3119164 RepID=UPI003136E69A
MTKARQIPVPTPETAHFWEGAKKGELLLQQCNSCEHTYFPPRPFCPSCGDGKIKVVKASGKGRIHTFIISNFRSPGFTPPYSIAVVQLDEGPRMLTNIVGCPQDSASIAMEMPVEVVFEPVSDDINLVMFKPVEIA